MISKVWGDFKSHHRQYYKNKKKNKIYGGIKK